MNKRVMPPIHPGEMLKEEFMEPMGLSANKLAQECNLAVTRITDIIRGRRGITADTALSFAARFGNSPEFWMNLQSRYDLEVAKMKMKKNRTMAKLKLNNDPGINLKRTR